MGLQKPSVIDSNSSGSLNKISSGKSLDLQGATNYLQTKNELKNYIKPEK